MTTLDSLKKEVFDYVRYSLGDGMVDVELDPAHYEQALKASFIRYRQRSSNSVEESYSFLELQDGVDTYVLPPEVISVKQLFRRTLGSTGSSSASVFEPFEAGYANMYLMQAGRTGGLLTFELWNQYQELNQRMFGGFINFHYNPVSRQLQLIRHVRGSGEVILLWTYNYKPDVTLLSDYRCVAWIRDYTLAYCKAMLGEAREKFASIAGPQGGTTLNGASLKAESAAMIERLENDLNLFIDGGTPYGFIIG